MGLSNYYYISHRNGLGLLPKSRGGRLYTLKSHIMVILVMTLVVGGIQVYVPLPALFTKMKSTIVHRYDGK